MPALKPWVLFRTFVVLVVYQQQLLPANHRQWSQISQINTYKEWAKVFQSKHNPALW
jgi:hypothetical protein